MDEKKEKSIWDEVDALSNIETDEKDVILEEKTEKAESEKKPEHTIFRPKDYKTPEEQKTADNPKEPEEDFFMEQEKVQKEVHINEERYSTKKDNNTFELKIETDDKAEKKGFLTIVVFALCVIVFAGSVFGIGYFAVKNIREKKSSEDTFERLRNLKNMSEGEMDAFGGAGKFFGTDYEGEKSATKTEDTDEILDRYKELYEENSDLIGWLTIDDTVIDYPVMQTPDDEEYYLKRDFDKNYNDNGCLIMDTDSNVGVGTKEGGYFGGESAPSTNLIIHGHTMKSGAMFGNLKLYEKEDYAKEHNIIKFDSLYESREYEVIAVFYSQVYYTTDTCFKYYKFFEAENQAEFDDWYDNIKELSLFDTGVEAELGDEFITLSCCAYHVEDGRFVVVGKRIK